MSNRSPFYDDWRECLRAHYRHVIRENDTNNEVSLRTVLIDTGFLEWEIDDLRREVRPDPIPEAAPEPTAELVAETIPEPVTEEVEMVPDLAAEPQPQIAARPIEPPPKKEKFYQPSLF